MIVVDANVALRWSFEMEWSDQATAVLQSKIPVVVPDLIIPEVTNALVFKLRERPDRVARAGDCLEFLPRGFVEVVPSVPLRFRAFALGITLDHPAYDCFYLALAEQRNATFITTDEHLLRKLNPQAFIGKAVHLADWRPEQRP